MREDDHLPLLSESRQPFCNNVPPEVIETCHRIIQNDGRPRTVKVGLDEEAGQSECCLFSLGENLRELGVQDRTDEPGLVHDSAMLNSAPEHGDGVDAKILRFTREAVLDQHGDVLGGEFS